MKKFIAVALLLSLLMSVPALAESTEAAESEEAIEATQTEESKDAENDSETDEPENVIHASQMDWSEDAEKAFTDAGYTGTWYTLTLKDIKMEALIPSGFEQRSVSDEEKADGLVLVFDNEEQKSSIVVADTILESYDNLEDIGNSLKEKNPNTLVQYVIINGKAALINGMEELDKVSVIFDMGDHRYIQIMFSPVTGNNNLIPFLMASLQY